MGVLDELKKTAQEVGHNIEKHTRPIRDEFIPPSTLDKARRAVKDTYRDEILPGAKGLKKDAHDMLHGAKHLFENDSMTADDFSKHANHIRHDVENSSFGKKFVGFLESAAELLTSFEHKAEKGIATAWKGFCSAVDSLCSTIKEMTGPSKPAHRSTSHHSR